MNPFVYSRPLAAADVVDCEQETERLLALAAGGHYARLYAPRRYGKTSLLLKALAEGEQRQRLVPVLVDLYGILSLADVTVRIERAYAAQLKGRLRELADRFLAATGLGLSLGAYGISVKLQLERRADPLPALHAQLDLPLRMSTHGGRRALIAFDEFQDVTNVDQLEALLRSHIQFQGEVACYVFSGSRCRRRERAAARPSAMARMSSSRQLARSATRQRLGRECRQPIYAWFEPTWGH